MRSHTKVWRVSDYVQVTLQATQVDHLLLLPVGPLLHSRAAAAYPRSPHHT